MKYIRYQYQGKTAYGLLEEETVKELSGALLYKTAETGATLPFGDVTLLAPCQPSKILAVGLNYKSHLGDRRPPANPEIFSVPLSALQHPGGDIVIPPDAKNLHYEGELVLVIGKNTRGVTPEEAVDCIFGFTCGNDVSERDWQKNDLQWWRAKGCDTFAPLGPAIVTDFDWSGSRIETRLNGTVVQSGAFSELLFNPPAIVSFVSRYITLYPGDIIYTGTPGTTKPLSSGDRVEVEIEGIGILRNRVR
jgi:2-keto-4-pentenoate hydratase/2-oxohepta-3-ene-1,7-dioic acid hydratase in catechol pathway